MRHDVWKVVLILIMGILLGLAFGYPWQITLLAALSVIGWQLNRLRKLLLWINQPTINAMPDSTGQLYLIHRELHRRARSARKRKRQLTTLFSQFRQAVSALPDAIILIDDAGHIRWANHNAERMFGVRWPSDANLRFGNLVRDPKLEELLARKSRIESIAATESPSPESVHNKQPDIGIEIGSNINPEQVLNIKSIPYTNELRMIVARDVTRLINVNRMHSDFVANVSHELKTPLTVLKGYLEILQNKPDLEPSWIKPLQQMSLQSDRMQLLVQDLLFLSKLEDRASRPRVSEVDVLQLINTITEMTQSEVAAKSHSLTLQIDQTINILGQKNELQSAFTNLIINAINYTHDGGSILIDWRQDNQCARLTVKDTGQGIPRHHIPRLTERFYRIDPDRSRAGGGTGLGLAIVKHVLQRHDASLEIESKEGKGSSFSCVFPMSRIIQRSIEHESLA